MAIKIRPAQPADRAAVFAISAQIWDGHDYLPEVWESWLHDPAGPLLVTLVDGVLAAVCKITLQSPSEAWLAGIRVDPAYRGQGLATATTRGQLEWCAARRVPVVRFTTASDNTGIHRLAGHLGFQRVGVVQHNGSPLRQGRLAPALRRLTPDEEPLAWEKLSTAPFLQATAGLYGVGWNWMRFSRARLRAHLARGEVLGWGSGPVALAVVVHRSRQTPRYVSLLAGPREACLALVQALGLVPALQGEGLPMPPNLRLPVPEGVADLSWIARGAGLVPSADHQMWLLERHAPEALP